MDTEPTSCALDLQMRLREVHGRRGRKPGRLAQLVERDACLVPHSDGGNSRACLILWHAGIIQWGIGANVRRPGPPNIVVHDGNIVQDFAEPRDIGERVVIWT